MSVSHYSEIESGYQRNGKHSDIDSEDLIRLLKANNVSLSYFFDLVESSYVVDDKVEKVEFLSKELYKAFNENNYKRAKEIRDQVQELPYVPKSLYYSAILITADLKDDMSSLDPNIKDKIDKYIYQSSRWFDNNEMLVIFGNSIPMLEKDKLVFRMNQLLHRYKQINTFPQNIQSKISALCINYLYDIILVRKEKDHVEQAFQLIRQLPANEIFAFKKIIARYLEDIVNGDITHAKDLKLILARSGLKNMADKLPI